MHTDMTLPDLAAELGIQGDTLRQWLRRNHPDRMRTVTRRAGGRQVLVAPEAAAAARQRYASSQQPDVHDRTRLDSAAATDRMQPDASAHVPAEPSPELLAAIARAAHAEGRSAALAGEVAALRGELAATRAALRESDQARGHMAARVGQMLDAWQGWRAEVDRLGRVALWRRRLPADPGAFTRWPELRAPEE